MYSKEVIIFVHLRFFHIFAARNGTVWFSNYQLTQMYKMKKNLSIVALLLLVVGAVFAQAPSQVTELTFQVGISDPTKSLGERPRNPINPPSASLDDHTLYINSEHPAYTLYLVDTTGDEPDVVYQVYVPANVNAVVLPSTLSGTYELQLYDGGQYYFYSDIEL